MQKRPQDTITHITIRPVCAECGETGPNIDLELPVTGESWADALEKHGWKLESETHGHLSWDVCKDCLAETL